MNAQEDNDTQGGTTEVKRHISGLGGVLKEYALKELVLRWRCFGLSMRRQGTAVFLHNISSFWDFDWYKCRRDSRLVSSWNYRGKFCSVLSRWRHCLPCDAGVEGGYVELLPWQAGSLVWSPWPEGWSSSLGVNICWFGPRANSRSLEWGDVRFHFHFRAIWVSLFVHSVRSSLHNYALLQIRYPLYAFSLQRHSVRKVNPKNKTMKLYQSKLE